MFIKNHLTLICYIASLLIYAGILLWGLFGDHRGSYFGYGMISFYVIIPLSSFVMAMVLNISDANLKWLYPFVFGLLGAIIPATVSWVKLSSWVMFLDVWPFVVLPAFIGSGVGFFIRINR